MYRAGIEGILGIRREGKELIIQPCIPVSWPGFQATIKVENTHYDIQVTNSIQASHREMSAILDGIEQNISNETVRVELDGGTHDLSILISCTG